ncbi:MAG: hypothetical protein U1E77_11860 [Inhella sp.]
MPTPSPKRLERPAALGLGLLLGLACVWAPRAHAHGEALLQPGWRVEAGVDLQAVQARYPWPQPLPGVLLLGDTPTRQDGRLRLGHGVLGAQARSEGGWGAELALELHQNDSPRLEQAALSWQTQAWSGQDLRVVAGRQRLRWGPLIDGAGHLDALSSLPLTKRAVLNERWSEDGLSLFWRPASIELQVQAGLWAGREFPAAPAGAWMPSLQAEGRWGDWALEAFVTQARPRGRGAALQGVAGSGHRHGALDCRQTLAQRVCFDGDSRLAGAALAWQQGPWRFSAAGLLRDEQGRLYSTNGAAALDSQVRGLWLQARWQASTQWQLAAQWERMSPEARLIGTGVALLARESGLAAAVPVQRASLSAAWQAQPTLSVGLEAAAERAQGGRSNTLATLRLVWLPHWTGTLP